MVTVSPAKYLVTSNLLHDLNWLGRSIVTFAVIHGTLHHAYHNTCK